MKLRKIVSLVLAVIMIGSCTLTAFAADTPEKQTFNYVALGDSIAAGFGLTDPDSKVTVEWISKDPALILNEDLLANPVAKAYPALFGAQLKEFGAERDVDVKTSNLSMSAYRASDVAKVLTTEGYVSDFGAFAMDYYLHLDASGLSKYHDLTVDAVKDADMVTVNLGGNDILINMMYDMYQKNNPVLNSVSLVLFMSLVGADMNEAMDLAAKELEKSDREITVEDISEAAKILGSFRDSADRYTVGAIDSVRDVVNNVKAINPDTDIAVVNMYSPFGNSLEYNGQVLDMSTVLTNIFKKAVLKATGMDVPAGDVEIAATGEAEDKIDDLMDNADELDKMIADDIKANDKSERLRALLGIIVSEISYPVQYLTIGKVVDARVKQLNEGLSGVAADTGSKYVDISGIRNENNLDPHPTAEGHQEIADILTATLAESVFPGCFDKTLEMTEGDVIADFAEAGAVCESSDPSVAWVDDKGALNAMKPGTALIKNGNYKYSVTVGDYSDGSNVVGSLKLLARYNDSMQFYDGHVYLLFTSYQDGVTINVPDLYAGYEIDSFYYDDIREDIANGSNHTDKDADKYFKLNKNMKSVTLNRGEIVTIGMYRDFDLTVPQAALGSIENSTVWSELTATAKAAVVEAVFGFLEKGSADTQEFVDRIKAICAEAGVDYTKLLDGVVDGGVCFNRELYNQKLEWDQYENVTYEMDITEKQLNTMAMYLGGNLNKFSIFKNSCATVALRAWNAAVGTRNGEDTSYKLTSESDGIFKIIDAPKGVRDNIVKRLPGYYLNNAQGVAEPGAGFEDETGSVYVSAPESVEPVNYIYKDDNIRILDYMTSLTALVNAAKAGQGVYYNKDSQDITVDIKDADGVIEGIDFEINGKTVTLNGDNMPEGGVWFAVDVDAPAEGETYYVTDADGKALASEYNSEDGEINFFAKTLPQSYRIISSDTTKNILVVDNDVPADAGIDAEIYYYKDGKKTVIDNSAELTSGTKVYVKPVIADDEKTYIIDSIVLDSTLIFDDDHYDAEEDAYFGIMPSNFSVLSFGVVKVDLVHVDGMLYQIFVGDTLNVDDVVHLQLEGEEGYILDCVDWDIRENENDAVSVDGNILKAEHEGGVFALATVKGNKNISALILIEVFESRDDVAAVTYDESLTKNFRIERVVGDNEVIIPYSGYMIKKGEQISVVPFTTEKKAVLYIICNGDALDAGKTYTVNEDTRVIAGLADAEIVGMPEEITLTEKGETYALDAAVSYKGLLKYIPPYDKTVTYASSSPLVSVDENGVITVAGDIPAEGARVCVTATAGSSCGSIVASTMVTLGNYQGDRIVGKLTIHARPIYEGELVAHSAVSFTAYEDMDLDVSYYEYYKPNDKYNDLMRDYADHPEKYSSDPALCSDDLDIKDRESYFDVIAHGVNSEPSTVSLKSGEGFTVSNYSFDGTHLDLVLRAVENGDIYSSPAAQALVYQMYQYKNGADVDTDMAFNGLVGTFAQIFKDTYETGDNPANGPSVGGICINRELYNQFRRNDSQMPNNYYSVDITADELELMKAYLANPDNNYYSIFTMNCGTGAVKVWNSTLSDKPELHISGSYTGFAAEPESIHFQIGDLTAKDKVFKYDGEGGKDFYPRTLAHKLNYNELIDAIDALGEPEVTDEYEAQLKELRQTYEELTDTEKSFVTNIDKLTEAEEKFDELKYGPLIAAFEEYKAEQIAAVDEMMEEDDSVISKSLASLAKLAINIAEYDKSKTPEENNAAVDAIVDAFKDSLEKQRELEKNFAEFEDYKATQTAAADDLLNEDDSAACKALAAVAKAAIRTTVYDPDKTPEENKAVVDAIVSTLADDLEQMRELEKNVAEFEDYKESQIDAADDLLNEDDSAACKILAAVAKGAIRATIYDPDKTPEENKADIDDIVATLADVLEQQREDEKNVAEFEDYKATQVAAIDDLLNEDDSAACKILAAVAKGAILASDYDFDKTPEENKAAVDAVVATLADALEQQRENEKNAAEFDAYKVDRLKAADELLNEDDSIIAKALVGVAKAAIRATVYDLDKTPEENKAVVDAILDNLAKALDEERYLEHPLLGDVDHNRSVEVNDATFIQRDLASVELPFILDDRAADVDKDGFISIVDASYIQRWLIKADTVEGIGEPI